MTDGVASAAELARYGVRPLVPGPLDVLRESLLRLGAGPATLPVLAERGAVEVFAIEGLAPDQTRVLERELGRLGGTLVSSVEGDRVVAFGSLIAFGMLPGALIQWGRGTEGLGIAVREALAGKGGTSPPVRAGDHLLTFGKRTLVMGVVNVTPDSFSGDGLDGDVGAALGLGRALVEAGADIVDVGGESTRPGHETVDAERERERVIPVVRALASALPVPVSVDTRKVSVARAAIDAGAAVVNDVWGLRGDPEMAAVVATAAHVAVIAMHNRDRAEYTDLGAEVCADLRQSLVVAERVGIDPHRVIVDPGFGFGKTPAHNLELMARLAELRGLGRPLLIGPSRKSTIGALLEGAPPQDRLEGTIALVVLAAQSGADMVRVHDVRECVRALRVADAVVRAIPASVRDLPSPGRTG